MARFTRGALLPMLAAAVGSAAALERAQDAIAAEPAKERERETVTGFGGFFFRARDPRALAQWYEKNLGILPVPSSYGGSVWKQEAGPTVFSPFPESTDYFGDPHKVWMLNFRVRNLDRMVQQLRASGIAVKVDPERYPNGRFARLHDPEENPIELWEPIAP